MYKYSPQEKGIYAFLGKKAGEFLVFIDESESCYNFMQLPDRHSISVTKKTFDDTISNKLLEFIEQIPTEVYEECIANIIKTS